MDFLIGLWREASRFTEMGDTLERVAGLLAGRTGADVLVVRRIDMQRSAIETVASAAVRPGGPVVSSPRNECTPRCLDALVAWAMRGQPLRAQLPADDEMLNALGPSGWRGDLVAGPLNTDDGPAGVLLLLGARGTRLGPGDEQVVGDLLGPVTVALGNHSRLKELGRLREALEADRQALLNRLERQDVSDSIVGAGTGLRSVMARVDQVARTDAPVLVIGETGTGKEVVARAIHARSKRAGRPIVRVNCGAIPIGLVDSELFGHERGAFTGAIASRKGWFERADGGTLFLDEVGELPPDAQVRLLRILQDGTFERVGGQRTLTVDVRLVAATHCDLHDMVAQGTFREDLWYRISVFPIEIPPLRERVEDIPMLAAHFARSAGHRLRGRTLVPSASDAALLSRYGWPGNVRELAAVIERAAILGDGLELRVAAALGGDVAAPPAPMPGPPARVTRGASEPLDARMRHHAQSALAWTGGRVDGPQGAAAVLKVNPHTLRARLRKLGVDWADFRPGASPGLARPAEAPSSWDAAMKQGIEDALVVASGRIEGVHGAAAALGVNPHTLRARMRKLGIDWATFRGASDPLSASYLS